MEVGISLNKIKVQLKRYSLSRAQTMKTKIYKAEDRGFANHGWLQANHSFSFASYHDEEKMQFGALRVLNDDIIAPSMGFSTHPHDNMEIITIPFSGVLKHRDSMANEWLEVKPNEVQVMSAGTGVRHSEINGSSKEYLSLFQIWIMPNKENVAPRYDQKEFSKEDRKNKLQVLVSSMDSSETASLKIHQDAKISRIDLTKGTHFEYTIKTPGNGVYMMMISGEVSVDNNEIITRDAIGVSETNEFSIKAIDDSEILFIEVPMH
jgi:redox-sensitive bicupin YhaK (pirin superfamily)